MKVTYWRNLVEVDNGTEKELTWDELCELLSKPRKFQGDRSHPGWSPAEFTGLRRSGDTVTRVWALTLDHDAGEPLDDVAGRLDGFARFLHTTRKHTAEVPRCRVVVPLSRPVSPFEFSELWKRFAPFAGEIDPAPKDPSRFWYLPGSATDAEFVTRRFEGESLPVDKWLARPDPTAFVKAPANWKPPRESVSVVDRARKYIAKMPAAVSGSGGHRATWDVALVLAKGFGLSEAETLEILRGDFNHRCDPPWSEKELAHKARQATNAKTPHGFKLQDDRDWEPSRRRELPEPPAWMDDDGFDSDPETEREELQAEREVAAPEPEKPKQSAAERFQVTFLRDEMIKVWERAQTRVPRRGYTTGVHEIDEATCGFLPEMVTVLGAPTSWGKSSYTIMVSDENILADVRILICGCEDAPELYAQRIMARRSQVNAMNLRDNRLGGNDIAKLGVVANESKRVPFVMDCRSKSAEWTAKGIAALVKEEGIQLVICDYLQRFNTDRRLQDRRNQVTFVSNVLSDAIKISGAAGLMLSQLKRTDNRPPTMDDLKESGDLENAAETVMLGHRLPTGTDRSGFTTYRRDLYLAKNKQGPVMMESPLTLEFNEVTASFKARKPQYAEDFGPIDYEN